MTKQFKIRSFKIQNGKRLKNFSCGIQAHFKKRCISLWRKRKKYGVLVSSPRKTAVGKMFEF